jgi:hypothetical protein
MRLGRNAGTQKKKPSKPRFPEALGKFVADARDFIYPRRLQED